MAEEYPQQSPDMPSSSAPSDRTVVASGQPGKPKWWQAILIGIVFAAFAGYVYYDFTKFEEDGGTRWMPHGVIWLYEHTGKCGPVGVLAFLALVALAEGVVTKVREWRGPNH